MKTTEFTFNGHSFRVRDNDGAYTVTHGASGHVVGCVAESGAPVDALEAVLHDFGKLGYIDQATVSWPDVLIRQAQKVVVIKRFRVIREYTATLEKVFDAESSEMAAYLAGQDFAENQLEVTEQLTSYGLLLKMGELKIEELKEPGKW